MDLEGESPTSGRQPEYNCKLDAGLLDSLNSVVNFLHSEGFFCAEEALLREIEERFSLEVSPASSPGGGGGGDGGGSADAGLGSAGAEGGSGTLEFHPTLQPAAPRDVVHEPLESAEK